MRTHMLTYARAYVRACRTHETHVRTDVRTHGTHVRTHVRTYLKKKINLKKLKTVFYSETKRKILKIVCTTLKNVFFNLLKTLCCGPLGHQGC